jgi:hypothetical protein
LQRDFLIIAAQCLVSLHGKDWLKTFLLTVKKVQLFAIISLSEKENAATLGSKGGGSNRRQAKKLLKGRSGTLALMLKFVLRFF